MTVRRFTQGDSDFLLCGIGGVAAMNLGAVTIAVLTKKELDGDFLPMVCGEITGASTRRSLTTGATDLITGELGGFSIVTPVTLDTADDWAVAAMSKVTGDVNLRGHKGVLGGVWTHGENTEGFDDNPEFTDPLTGIRIASHFDSSSFDSGLYAVVGIWLRQLSDLEFQSGLRTSLEAWRKLAPDWLIRLDQASVATAVQDLTGGGGDQIAIQGTSVVTTDDPPGFSFDGTVLGSWGQSTWNSTTGLTLNGLQDHVGKRLIIVGADRGGGQTVTLSGTDAGLVTALNGPIVSRVTNPTDSGTRRSVWMWSCVIPSVGANPIVAPDIRDGSNVEQTATVTAWVVDIDSSYELAGVASADSGASAVSSQVTGTTPAVSAGDQVVAVGASVRGDGTSDWTDSEDELYGGQFVLEQTSGTGAAQRKSIGGHAFNPGEISQTYQDTLNLGTARLVSTVIAVFSTGGSGAATVDLSPGVIDFVAVPVVPVPQPVSITLSPGVMVLAPVASTPVPQPVVINLSPGIIEFVPLPLQAVGATSIMLSPAILELQPVPLVPVPGGVTIDLSPGVLYLVPVPIGQTGAEVDVTVVVGPTRTGSVTVGQSRTGSVAVGLTRDDRGN